MRASSAEIEDGPCRRPLGHEEPGDDAGDEEAAKDDGSDASLLTNHLRCDASHGKVDEPVHRQEEVAHGEVGCVESGQEVEGSAVG